MNKKAKNPIIPICICVAVVLVIVGVAVLLINQNNKNTGSGNGGDSTSNTTDNNSSKVTSSELRTGTITDNINYGDYSSMFTLSKAIQNGEKTGALVSIDGIVSYKGKSYSIGQNNPDGGNPSYVGTVFTIEDGAESDYPKDGDHITITAKVVELAP